MHGARQRRVAAISKFRKIFNLKVNVYPKNIAETISFLAGPRASCTTGGAIR